MEGILQVSVPCICVLGLTYMILIEIVPPSNDNTYYHSMYKDYKMLPQIIKESATNPSKPTIKPFETVRVVPGRRKFWSKSLKNKKETFFTSNLTMQDIEAYNNFPNLNITSCVVEKQFPSPVRSFFYYALHKTGSTVTRAHLTYKCMEDKISCLTYPFCENGLNKLMTCNQGIEKVLDTGSFTAKRLNKCCSKALQSRPKLESVVEHFYMFNDDVTRSFLKKHLPPPNEMFRFTVFRHPVEQFVSYYYFARGYRHFSGSFESVVDNFYREAIGKTKISRDHPMWQTHQNLVNYQTKEISGWNGTEQDLARSLEIVKSLNFVGIYEELPLVWKNLRKILGWEYSAAFNKSWCPRVSKDPRTMTNPEFESKTKLNRKTGGLPLPKVARPKSISPKVRKLIERIQWADMQLYNLGKDLWSKCFKQIEA